MSAQLTHIYPLTFVRRNRTLPGSGEVTVRIGQKVSALDNVAEAEIATRHYLVDVARALNVTSLVQAEKLMQRKAGDQLEKGDIIAETGGSFSHVIRTPGKGKVISINAGRVLIEAESRTAFLKAGMDGTISSIIPERGVTIDMIGALIQGAWGNDKVGRGTLLVHQGSIDGELSVSTLTESSSGMILLAGWCSSQETLKQAAARGIGGLILGSMPSVLIAAALSQPYPIIALGGFGKFGFDPISGKLLTTNAGREAAINACQWDRLSGVRPEVYIELPAEAEPYQENIELALGQTVRVHASSHLGKTGRLTRFLPGLKTLPGGIRSSVVEVKFNNAESVVVPLANLDIIGLNSPFLSEKDEGR